MYRCGLVCSIHFAFQTVYLSFVTIHNQFVFERLQNCISIV